jgi:hypothetical protein
LPAGKSDHDDPGHLDVDDDASWTDDAVLNACRAWQRISTGHWSSKVAAGEQLLAHRPDPAADRRGLDPAAVRLALAARRGGVAPSVSRARGFQREVLAALERVAGPQ